VTIKTLFSPGDDTAGEFLGWIGQAKKSVYLAIYEFHLAQLTASLLTLHQAGVAVHVVLDSSRASGEQAGIAQLKQAGIDLAIGTSDKHQIMHDKFAIVDEVSVEDGSWNYSVTASSESNVQNYVDSPARAAEFLVQWQLIHDWIVTNEPQ
jgi:phosphatidylserine/phosphatidylglycerophosphate/cardiolipin synthase-like enzyme